MKCDHEFKFMLGRDIPSGYTAKYRRCHWCKKCGEVRVTDAGGGHWERHTLDKKDGMKVITLCGSTKFRKHFERVMARLTLEGNIVISVGLYGHEFGMDMNSEQKRMLDKMHFQKIDMADEVFVINPGGYIGLSTCDEIHYAMATGKTVKYHIEPHCEE